MECYWNKSRYSNYNWFIKKKWCKSIIKKYIRWWVDSTSLCSTWRKFLSCEDSCWRIQGFDWCQISDK